ncbi:hypothetical protein [Pediococcus pentosaceus]|uniref:hypothetical protein n=1 Tax=Pediococcus pentosaceus TaxID=1255 RepID=UPI00133070B2|nr:hypothetical protein [Pediococcus pentosaceus]KAF0422865.1 hypothetical protein GBO84_06000 [Pediococcus pentosaceus]MBF7122784.1 hypothetical protein [Pediococcus pentosaceus]
MKYEYSNMNEPREIATTLEMLNMKLQLAFQKQDTDVFNEALTELKQASEKVNNFKPVIKINVED